MLPGLVPYMALRATGGVLLVTSFVLFAINVLGTYINKREIVLPTGGQISAAAASMGD